VNGTAGREDPVIVELGENRLIVCITMGF